MPKVSVIIPVYNTEKTISRCLESVIKQTLADIEIIIVDDGTPDQAIKIAENYQKKDSRIKIVRQKNQGLGAARNCGIRNASGKYVSCVDSDDYIDEQMLEKMYEKIELNQAEIAICQANNVLYDNGKYVKSLGEYCIPGHKEVITGKKAVTLQLNYIVPILFNSVCFKMIKRTMFQEYNIEFPEKFRYAEDTPASVGLMLNAKKVVLVRESLYFYVRENHSLTSTYSLKKSEDIYMDLKEICEYARVTGYTGTMSNFILGMLFPMVKQIVWSELNDSKDIEKREKLLAVTKKLRCKKDIKPDFSIKGIPLIQKIKILCAYYGLTPYVCKIIKVFKWIPFVKYMV